MWASIKSTRNLVVAIGGEVGWGVDVYVVVLVDGVGAAYFPTGDYTPPLFSAATEGEPACIGDGLILFFTDLAVSEDPGVTVAVELPVEPGELERLVSWSSGAGFAALDDLPVLEPVAEGGLVTAGPDFIGGGNPFSATCAASYSW